LGIGVPHVESEVMTSDPVGGPRVFASTAVSEQQLFTLYAIGLFLTVAPLVMGLAALLGYIHRGSRPVG
jgi:hypothetical protein